MPHYSKVNLHVYPGSSWDSLAYAACSQSSLHTCHLGFYKFSSSCGDQILPSLLLLSKLLGVVGPCFHPRIGRLR